MSGGSIPELSSGVIHCINSFTGSAMIIPTANLKPGGGYLDAQAGYFGMAPPAMDFAALSVTSNPAAGQATSIFCTGNNEFIGITNLKGVLNVTGTSTVTGTSFTSNAATNSLTGTNTLSGTNTITGTSTITGASVSVTAPSVSITGGNVSICGTSWWAHVAQVQTNSTKKWFDIKHPTKEKHRLRYICLEGPAAEVYVRGKLDNENIIELPEYWEKLVDVETIGVSLTPVGHYQELFVKEIESETHVIIGNQAGSAINCYYTVFAERKDVDKNISEYEGLTPKDYPGDNREYSNERSWIWSK